jgi:hypothetical protein
LRDDFDDPRHAVAHLRGLPCPWGVCGGWAVDLFVNQASRRHADVDFAVLRADQPVVLSHLLARGWSISTAHGGQVSPWKGDELIEFPMHCLWCRNENAVPTFIEVLLNESAGEDFVFRRCFDIRLPLSRTFLKSKSGIPILAPEIVLLYKSKGELTPTNAQDFENAVESLASMQRRWLKDALLLTNPTHPWVERL